MRTTLYAAAVVVLGVTLGLAMYLGRASWQALNFFFPRMIDHAKHPNDAD